MKHAISNDPLTGTTRRQPVYDDPIVTWAGLEASECDWPEAIAEMEKYHREAKSLEKRWARWYAAKNVIDADWKDAAEKELNAVTEDVERDQLLARLESIAEADRQKDEQITAAYCQQMIDLAARAADAWRANAVKQLNRVTVQMNKELVRREKKTFLGHA